MHFDSSTSSPLNSFYKILASSSNCVVKFRITIRMFARYMKFIDRHFVCHKEADSTGQKSSFDIPKM